MPDTIGRSQVKARTLASKTVRFDPFIACLMLVTFMLVTLKNVRMPSLTDEGGFRRSYLRRGYHQKNDSSGANAGMSAHY